MKDISATDASRNFSRLLDEVEQGKEFSITRGGKVVATVSPPVRHTGAQFTEIFRRLGPNPELADAIEEGRRYMLDQEPWC